MNVDWVALFQPQTPLLEIFVRGTIVYLSLFIMLRVILKRESGTVGITDLLVVVLLADAAQNAMAGSYSSITDGLLLVATIIFWSYALDALGYRFAFIQWLVRPPAIQLVKEGKMIRKNMRKEFITEAELTQMLRQQGVEDIGRVEKAFMEGDGRISVITRDGEQHQAPKNRGKD